MDPKLTFSDIESKYQFLVRYYTLAQQCHFKFECPQNVESSIDFWLLVGE